MSAPSMLNDLIERFENNLDAYKSPKYNETQLRQEFINPLFESLGWDVNNKKGYAEAYKDVVHEDAIKVGGATKAPDYSFRIGGVRKFFLETKRPSVNIKDDPEPAFQLRRYAWSAKLPLSILTDFEELAVYDCRIKPAPNDKPSTGRIMYFNYKEYPEKWKEISSVFSREAILKGLFDRFVESEKKKRGTAEVDDAFLKEIESWRDAIARNIALRNEGLTERDINYAVQITIDRIIFLRICEDRGIEEYGRLQALINGEHVYKRMLELYYRADEKYNSGLFHFQSERGRPGEPDELTPDLKIDDKVLKDIIKGLYYPVSPYEFSVLPVDILGHVYERFLGKVIRLTAGGRAKVEEKPEVKKSGGVYYTPKYIVDYIVENTVGRLLWDDVENRKSEKGNQKQKLTPKQAAKLRILDPACGSGSFLIGAYEYLLDWHRDWYVDNDPTKYTKQIYQGAGGQWYLTTAEKKKILLNNIYGVDIDAQAVEVTKLNLLLKTLEGESEETIESQLKMFRERALPDLRGNIKCGNSLIGPDFYDNTQLDLLDDEERYRINAFDWEREFGEIMKGGGFDAVIGNPPYVRQELLMDFKEYFKRRYQVFNGIADIYVYFFEISHQLLSKGGFFGMICSNKFMRSNYGRGLRDFLLNRSKILKIIDFGELPVFTGPATFPAILITTNEYVQEQEFVYTPIKSLKFTSLENEVFSIGKVLTSQSLQGEYWSLAEKSELIIFEKMKRMGISLKSYVGGKVYFGIKTGLNSAFIIDKKTKQKLIRQDKGCRKLIVPFLKGDDVRKYHINYRDQYLILIPTGFTKKNSKNSKNPWKWFQNNYPSIANHLKSYEVKASKRTDKGDYWWELRPCDYYDEFNKPKIIYPDIAKESRFAFDDTGYYLANTIYFIPQYDLYLLGILNSKLIFNYFKRHASVLGDADKGGRLRWFRQDIFKIPIRTINFSDSTDKSRHDQMTNLVDKMLDLHKQLTDAKSAPEKTAIQRHIDATDRQIDELVYELYGITEEERRVVEG